MLKKIMLFIFMILITSSGHAVASNDRVVFYPSGADISRLIHADITAGNNVDSFGRTVTFILPGQALPDTFSITPVTKEVVINDVSWTRDDLTLSPAAVDLGKKIDLLKSKLMAVKAQIKAVEGGILFWNERGKIQQTKVGEVDKIADLVVSNLTRLYNQSVKLESQSKDISSLINELNRKIKEISGPGKSRWIVKVSVAASGNKSADFKINYMLRNCGWRPKYKLDGYPDQKKVEFSFDAEIWQSSGMDFKNFNVALATVKERSRIYPPELRRWKIAPKRPDMPEPAKYARSMKVMESSVQMNDAVAANAPLQIKKSTYSIWELGTKTIVAGPARKYAISNESWDAEYSFLSRPSATPDVFVSAKMKLIDAKDFPTGQALVLMEGAMIGKMKFSFFGKDKTLFFGADPLLKAERKTLEKYSGEKGVFGSKQTYNWKYLITLSNSRKNPVMIKVQEPAPFTGDKRIKLSDSAEPKAVVKDNNFEWDITVPASQKAEVQYGVDLNAPEDMIIDFGLGR
ncbi:DUF4139 domain-containing protein [Maridesulfovibrio ferrireducens]|uniref:DUF4139 domain-containing protein n=1 Tax=Maridesulfovibrio ferrireducens TaxID=246191 RepID=UPI0026F0442B|nr:DUF4139 domain-containing protein [Maridesulfovibrio ferrireducens]